jgi:CheY-like chemotaxis protein
MFSSKLKDGTSNKAVETSKEKINSALVTRPPSAIEKADLRVRRILSDMVADTLAIAKIPGAAKADVELDFTGKQPLGKCPSCGSNVFEAAAGYLCERARFESQACKFKIGKTVLGQPIDAGQMRQLLTTGKTDLLDRFVAKGGRLFAAYLVISAGKIVFEFPPLEVPPRIVVVDDSSDVLQLMGSLIHSWFKDAMVLLFQDGETAWRELLRANPDVLITDLQRPSKMDGWEMIRLLAERKVKYPIVVVTGYTKGPNLDDKTLSDDVQDMLRRVRPTLNVTALAKSFDNESLRMVLEPLLNVHRDKPHAG